MIRLKIDIRLPSLNEYVKACRTSIHEAAKFKRDTEDQIMWFINKIPEIENPSRFHFIWYEQTKKRDKDNVAFAKKFIFDALQKAGKLPNDNNHYVVGFSDDFVYNQGDGVIVEIIEEKTDINEEFNNLIIAFFDKIRNIAEKYRTDVFCLINKAITALNNLSDHGGM